MIIQKRYLNEWQQAFLALHLRTISLKIKIQSITDINKHLHFATFSGFISYLVLNMSVTAYSSTK